MQSFTTDKDFLCSIKFLHGRLNIVSAKYRWCLTFDAVCSFYTRLTNFSTKYLVMCKVYTDVGGINYLYYVCPPLRQIVHLKLVDYLHVQADNPWYNYYLAHEVVVIITSASSLGSGRTVSPEYSLLAYTKYERRERLRPNIPVLEQRSHHGLVAVDEFTKYAIFG